MNLTNEREVMTMRFTNSVLIDWPVSEVFAFVSNFENMPRWNYFIVETTNQSRPAQGIGTTYSQRRKTDMQRYVVTEYTPDHLVAIRTVPPSPDLEMRFTLEPAGPGTRLTDEWQLHTGLPGWVEGIAAGRV